MTLKEVFSPYFKVRDLEDFWPMVCPCFDSEFCMEMITKDKFTLVQMVEAACNYYLGKARNGKTIYWMIDEHRCGRDGHVGNHWISQVMKQQKLIPYDMPINHCLFGQHLLRNKLELNEVTPEALSRLRHVSIVEEERSAVILSVLYPQSLWMATSYPANMSVERLKPLQGRTIRLFPKTDPIGATFVTWDEIARQSRERYHLDITVDDTLEAHATDAQRESCIDLVGFLFDEGSKPSEFCVQTT